MRRRTPAASAALVLAALAAGACTPPQAASQGTGAAQPSGPPPPLTAAARPAATGGERLFVQKCGMCHGPGGMGTGLLARRVEQPLLEKRADLNEDYVTQAARLGIGNMPATPRGEVSDEELRQIAGYLVAAKTGARQ